MNKVTLISIYLDGNGLKEIVREYEYKQSPSGLIVNKESNFGGKTKRLKAGDILKIQSNIRENLYHVIEFHTWCFDNQIKEAKELLYKKMWDIVRRQADVSALLLEKFLYEYIDRGYASQKATQKSETKAMYGCLPAKFKNKKT